MALFRSGTEEEYTELQQLLEDVSTYKRDTQELKEMKAKRKANKKEKEKEKLEKGLEMREAALVGMTSKQYVNEAQYFVHQCFLKDLGLILHLDLIALFLFREKAW